MSRITVYTTAFCPYCSMAKALLKKKGIDFKEIDLQQDPKLRQELSKRTGMRTVPMIFVDDTCVGGSDELHSLERSGELDRLLAASPT